MKNIQGLENTAHDERVSEQELFILKKKKRC